MSALFDMGVLGCDYSREIILDSFAGGGGASTGIEIALGRSPDVAVNHDPEAVAMHAANHPSTRHLCQNVWQVNPSEVAALGPIGLAWFSPDCKHFSKAKGGKPVEKRIRDLAWIVVAYAKLPAHLRPRVIFLENVEEFQTWGPLTADGQPDPARRGETFKKWLGELRRHGYRVEWRELRACDFGAPTIRKRLCLIARCDGQPIVWPEPTHGPGRPLPYRTAADIIDWSLPCPSIFLTKEEARAIRVKRPLQPATMRRIFNGLRRYVLENAKPFIVPVTHSGGPNRGHAVDEPLKTVTGAHRGEMALVTPYLAGCGGRAAQSPERSADAPMGTITAKADQIIVAPHLTRFHTKSTGGAVSDPMVTVETHLTDGLVAPYLTKFHGESAGAPADEPAPTITANSFHKRPGGNPPVAVVMPWLVQQNTGVVGHAVEEPVSTVLQTGSHQMLAAAHLMTMRNAQKPFNGADEPTHTITAGGAGLAQGFHHAEVRAFLVKYFGSAEAGQTVDEPLHTVTAKPRFGLVTVAGEQYEIADIGMRMLTPRELFRAQGFPETYKIDIEIEQRTEKFDRKGNLVVKTMMKPLPKSSQVRMCGNSVCPPLAAALVRANVPELARVREAAE